MSTTNIPSEFHREQETITEPLMVKINPNPQAQTPVLTIQTLGEVSSIDRSLSRIADVLEDIAESLAVLAGREADE